MIELFEIFLLALTIFFEASGEGYKAQIAHAWVVKNRVEHSLFPDNYYDVIFQNKQFSCYNADEIVKHIKRFEYKTFKKCFNIAHNVYHDRLKDITDGAMWYARKDIRRVWMKKLKIKITYKNTVFYGIKDNK